MREGNGGGTGSGAERLRVYQLALEFAADVHTVFKGAQCRASLVDQGTRSANSGVLNIAEGSAHYSPGKKIYHYQLAHGSTAECLGALKRLNEEDPKIDSTRIRYKGEMICIMLVALIKSVRGRLDPPPP